MWKVTNENLRMKEQDYGKLSEKENKNWTYEKQRITTMIEGKMDGNAGNDRLRTQFMKQIIRRRKIN